ncbi:MAG: hypothetical protein OES12_03045, partial [Anaerolineae bacterium]|nr:hypothetical protein [Anaerolineae bacterium]
MSYHRAYLPVTRTLKRLRGAFWRRRIVHWWVRALWLALLVPTIVIAGYLWRGWQIPWQIWLGVMMIVAIIAIMWPLRPINLKKMTHRVDGLLGLRAQLITAFEVSQVNPTQGTTQTDNPVVQQLVRDTVHVTIGLRRQVKPFGRGFWLEVQMLIAVAAILGAMLLFDLIRPEIPNVPPVDLPQAGQEPQADEVIPPDPRLQQPPPQLQAL